MITALLAAVTSAGLAAATAQKPDPAEQVLLEQIHRCAVEVPMPDFCEDLLERLIDGEQP